MNRHQRLMNLRAGLALATVSLVTLAGCATHSDFDAFLDQPGRMVSNTEYLMEPPDAVLITSKRVREINNHRETIRSDGRLTLPLLGSVFVAGKTTEAVSAELEALARDYYDDADVSVRVVGYNSKKYFVFGEVSRPGPYAYDGANTVLETLAAAQPSRLANSSRIRLLRPTPDGELIPKLTIDLNRMVREGDTSLNAVIEEGDILYVPPTALASVGLTLQQLLLPVQPALSTVQAPTDFNRSFNSRPYSSSGRDQSDF